MLGIQQPPAACVGAQPLHGPQGIFMCWYDADWSGLNSAAAKLGIRYVVSNSMQMESREELDLPSCA